MKIILSKYWPEIILGVLVVGFVLACLNQNTNNESLAAASGLNTGQWLYVIASVALTGLFCYWIFGGNSSPISQNSNQSNYLVREKNVGEK